MRPGHAPLFADASVRECPCREAIDGLAAEVDRLRGVVEAMARGTARADRSGPVALAEAPLAARPALLASGRLRSATFERPWDGRSPPDPSSASLVFQPSASQLWIDGRNLDLSRAPRLARLLLVFLHWPGRRLSKRQLCEKVWPGAYRPPECDRRLFFALHRLRRLLEADPARPRRLLYHADEATYSVALEGGVVVALTAQEVLEEGLPERLRRMLLWLASASDPRVETYAGATGIPVARARRELARLVRLGLVTVHGPSRGRTFRIAIPLGGVPPIPPGHPQRGHGSTGSSMRLYHRHSLERPACHHRSRGEALDTDGHR